MNRRATIMLAMMETMVGRSILRKPIRQKSKPKQTRQIPRGARNKVCPICRHKNKKCTCPPEN